MRIAVVLPSNEPFSPLRGGALARWVYEVYRRINVDCLVFAAPDKNAYTGLNLYQVPTENFTKYLKGSKQVSHHLKYNLYPLVIALYCKWKNINTIHILNRPAYALVFRKVLPKARIILHMQNSHLLSLPDKLLADVMKSNDEIISCSKFLNDEINERTQFSFDKKLKVIFNGANTYNSAMLANLQSARSNSERSIVFVGRVVREKGVLELINAFSEVCKSLDNVHLYIIGGHHFGDDYESDFIHEVKFEASKLKDKVTFTGYLTHDQILPILVNASIFVCPSTWEEPFGMVLTEAMAVKLPIIASNRGGIPEVIGNTGILIEPENTNQFADAIIYLLENPDIAKELGLKGHERLHKHFTWEQISSEFISLIKS
ncbi:glycosyltransferase family 4 protein [Pontibacter qinzhouensis]|uniref:Glycosyltransferase family 4 protein n=1 Tax=Pontibacter qinzhouensis TaxID=2603253 RepID=A0A5C8K8L9_9BACT|nr:glycosyltransferase family 4 protein [Pontibacter qinzhouensis]TXK46967.1 glycosyltransferase family 4 protein [Pontibacter qinzhouensis]